MKVFFLNYTLMKVIWWWVIGGSGCIGQKPGHLDASLELLNKTVLIFQSTHIFPQALPVRSVLGLVTVRRGEGRRLRSTDGGGGCRTSVPGADSGSLRYSVATTDSGGCGHAIPTTDSGGFRDSVAT